MELARGDGALHLHHRIARVIAGALAELHLDAWRTDRLCELSHLTIELCTSSDERGPYLVLRSHRGTSSHLTARSAGAFRPAELASALLAGRHSPDRADTWHMFFVLGNTRVYNC